MKLPVALATCSLALAALAADPPAWIDQSALIQHAQQALRLNGHKKNGFDAAPVIFAMTGKSGKTCALVVYRERFGNCSAGFMDNGDRNLKLWSTSCNVLAVEDIQSGFPKEACEWKSYEGD